MRMVCLMLMAIAIGGASARAWDDVQKGPSSSKKPAAARCAAKSSSGARCNRKVVEGSQYCAKHPDGVMSDSDNQGGGKPSKKSDKKS